MMNKNKFIWTLISLVGIIGFSCSSDDITTDPAEDETTDPVTTEPVDDPTLEGTIKEQYETDIDIYYTVAESGYTIDEPYVVLDPYGVAPLSAYVCFETEEAVSITVAVSSNGKSAGISYAYEETDTMHFIPVHGLYENYDNEVTITSSNGDVGVIEIETSSVSEAPDATITTSTSAQMSEGFTFTISAETEVQSAYDEKGYLRHVFTDDIVGGGNHFFKAENGNFICSNGEVVKQPYYRTHIAEVNALGKILVEYEIPGATHHDVRELPSGNLIVATNSSATSGSEDVVVEISRETGNIVKTWDIGDYLPENSGSSLLEAGDDWFHNNSVFYDENSDQLILSGRHRDAVIAIDYSKDELSWIFGTSDGWNSSMSEYFFDAKGSDFEWQWGQHSAIMTDNGELFLFDNGNNRSKDKSSAIDNEDNYSRAVMYSLDTDNMEATQTWQFGKDRGYDFFSSFISEVNYLDEDHYLVVSGAVSSSSGRNSTEGGVIVEIVNDVVVFGMEIPVTTYRVERTNPYSANGLQFLVKGKSF